MKKFFLDTNIFLSFFARSSKQHKECLEVFNLVEERKIVGMVSSVVIMEIFFTLRSFYNYKRKSAQKIIEQVLLNPNIKTTDEYDYKKAIYLSKNFNVKFTDCLIASLSFVEKNGIVSYDKDFEKLKIKRFTPPLPRS